MDSQGHLERTLKVREKSGNLKINGYGSQSSENLFILLRGERITFSRDSLSPSPSAFGATLNEKNFLREQILSFKSNPQI